MAASDFKTVYALASANGVPIPLDVIKPEMTRILTVTNAAMGAAADIFPTATKGIIVAYNMSSEHIALKLGATPITAVGNDIDYDDLMILAPETEYTIFSEEQYLSAICLTGTAANLVITRITKWDALTLTNFLELGQ